jgi:hypothetical protein
VVPGKVVGSGAHQSGLSMAAGGDEAAQRGSSMAAATPVTLAGGGDLL